MKPPITVVIRSIEVDGTTCAVCPYCRTKNSDNIRLKKKQKYCKHVSEIKRTPKRNGNAIWGFMK